MRRRVWHASFFWPEFQASSPKVESLYLTRHPVLDEAEMQQEERRPALLAWQEIDCAEDPQAYRYALFCIEENEGEPMPWEDFVKKES